MKLILTVILFIVFNPSFAQNLKTTSVMGYTYSAVTQSYVPNSLKVEYADESGFVVREEKYEYSNGDWVPTYLTESTFDENTFITHSEIKVFANGKWLNLSEYSLYLNSLKQKDKEVWREWVNNTYVDSRQSLYSYENDMLRNITQQTNDNGNWINSVKEDITYNPDGTESERMLSTWSNAWMESSKTSSTWDSNGNLVTETIEANMGGIWGPFQQTNRQYNDVNDLTYYESLTYDSTVPAWVPSQNIEIEYDEWGQKLLAIYSNYIESGTGSWEPYWKDEYEYEDATSIENEEEIISDFYLTQNYPNPFNPSTNISFTLPMGSEVELVVYSVTGETVARLVSGYLSAGVYTEVFDATYLSSGIYFFKLQTDAFVEVKKMLLLK